MRYLIGLDLGTTTVKASLYTIDGVPVTQTSKERILLTPEAGHYEQDAASWYTDSAKVISQAVREAGIAPESVIGLSISSQGITTVAVDENLEPLTNAINWMDVRPVRSWEGFLDRAGEAYVKSVTGFPAVKQKPKFVAKILWVRDEMPEVFDRAAYFLMPAPFVTAKLTGKVLTDHTMASGSLLYSNFSSGWDEKLLDAAQLDRNLFPKIVPTGTPAGYLTERAAKDCGLTQNCLVSVGGQDQKVSAYAVSADEHTVACSFGTSAAFECITNSPENNFSNIYKVCPYIDENKYAVEVCINAAGASLRWMRDTMLGGAGYEPLNELVRNAPIGSNGIHFMPFLGGKPTSNGFAAFNDVGLHSTLSDIARSIYEGIAFEARYLTEAVIKNAELITLYSGGSKSRELCEILADVLDFPVKACRHAEIGSLGAAKLAKKGTGLPVDGFGEECLKESTVYYPKHSAEYEKFYEEYTKLRP